MFDSLKKHCTVSRWQRYNVYLKVNICVCVHLYNSSTPILEFLFMVPESFLALPSASEGSAVFLMAAQLVFLVHLSSRVF